MEENPSRTVWGEEQIEGFLFNDNVFAWIWLKDVNNISISCFMLVTGWYYIVVVGVGDKQIKKTHTHTETPTFIVSKHAQQITVEQIPQFIVTNKSSIWHFSWTQHSYRSNIFHSHSFRLIFLTPPPILLHSYFFGVSFLLYSLHSTLSFVYALLKNTHEK